MASVPYPSVVSPPRYDDSLSLFHSDAFSASVSASLPRGVASDQNPGARERRFAFPAKSESEKSLSEPNAPLVADASVADPSADADPNPETTPPRRAPPSRR